MIRVIDVFSGIGGFSLGLESTGGFQTIAFCEIEPFPREVLAVHWPEVPCFTDVRELKLSPGDADMIVGGFPCQDISVAGKGAGIEGERSGLWRELFRLVQECRPRWVLVENVSALRTRGADRVLSDLEAEGYACWPLVVGAWAVGAPHRRERVWIVAHRQLARREATGLGHPLNAGCEPFARGGALELSNSDAGRRGRQERTLQAGRDEPLGAVGLANCHQRGPQGEHAGDAVSGRATVAEPEGERRSQQGHGRLPGSWLGCDGPRWPARPGEPQHEWEEPRLVGNSPRAGRVRAPQLENHAADCDGGRGSDPSDSDHDDGGAQGRPEQPLGSAAHGLPVRLALRANRESLKALGNSVVPQVVAAIGRAILAVERG